jgi:hypothetical protein
VYLTFQQTKRYNEEIEHLKGIASGYKIRTWEIGDPSCTCKRSLDECKKRYSRNNPPSLPFHIGCRCEIQGLI